MKITLSQNLDLDNEIWHSKFSLQYFQMQHFISRCYLYIENHKNMKTLTLTLNLNFKYIFQLHEQHGIQLIAIIAFFHVSKLSG